MGKHSQLKPFQFKKGQSGNPGGPNRLPEIIREARKVNKLEFEECLSKYIRFSDKDLTKVFKTEGMGSLDRLVISIIKLAIDKGDAAARTCLLDRMIGKVTQVIKDETPGGHMALIAYLNDKNNDT